MTAEAPRADEEVEKWRAFDTDFVEKHFALLRRRAQRAYDRRGRGALFVDATTIYDEVVGGEPRPQMEYEPLPQIAEHEDPSLVRLVEAYDPKREFIGVLCHLQEDIAYRIGRGKRRISVSQSR